MRVAVIGSGIAGLAAAWYAGERHHVTLYERHDRAGMAAHSVRVGASRVDLPMRVVYSGYYPTLTDLYAEAGIETVPLDYAASYSWVGGATWFRYRNLRSGSLAVPMIAGDSASGSRARAIAADCIRYFGSSRHDLERGQVSGTLGAYLAARGYCDDFVDGFLLPSFAGIGTCTLAQVAAYPAKTILEYTSAGILFESVRRAVGGATEVADRLSARVDVERFGSGIAELKRRDDGVHVRAEDGSEAVYERVIVATPADQALRFVVDASDAERRALQSFEYQPSRVVLHTDARLAPTSRADWAPVNFLLAPGGDAPMATIWLNPLDDGLRDEPGPVLQTWNPLIEPAPDRVLADVSLARPVVTAASEAAIQWLDHESRGASVRFCGSYAGAGVPLLESAVVSARRVAQTLV